MNKDPFENIQRAKTSQSFIDVILRILGFGHQGSIIGFIAWIIATVFQVLSVGAKLLTRRKLGIRTAGRIRFFVHVFLFFGLVWLFPSFQDFDAPLQPVGAGFSIYMIVYFVIIFILWLKNLLEFRSRKGIEGYSYFRGHGFFTSTEKPNAKKNRWLRLIDPLILGFILWAGVYFLGDTFLPVAILLSISSVILFMEECLYIYDEYNFDLDMKDAISLAEGKVKSNESLKSDY